MDYDYDYEQGHILVPTIGTRIINQKSKAKAIDFMALREGNWITDIKAHFLRPGKPKKKKRVRKLPEYLDLPF